jgi:hypothetical protein
MSMQAFTEKIITRNAETNLIVCKQILNDKSCSKLLTYSVKLQLEHVKDFFRVKMCKMLFFRENPIFKST